jgi:hypothetical protein
MLNLVVCKVTARLKKVKPLSSSTVVTKHTSFHIKIYTIMIDQHNEGCPHEI